MSQLVNAQTAKVHITFTLEDGTVVPASPDGQPVELVVGEPCGFKAVDDALPTMAVGEERTLQLTAEEAFGLPDPNLRFEIERAQVQAEGDIQPGMAMQMDNGDGQVMTAIIHEVTETTVRVDANHPLAGEALACKIEVVSAV
ncbi:Peptidyl-prolyl cis-trans isomerase [Candidatus Terasakiella magnetica]|uniref:Peptidyl-prolyl cis-trans isomerase n=1 Tax=Candidatus Terasakiella magnetica TaxID=1867952 RepID=A0A1C3RIZ7_9PROT|nr:FKBP-type peptidyl-prolyl cis-trans isomerase [Candidatus Terasakiella magnetica]SCA57239.1 Peptidyl-prolyl cis-trans isomerase [Candidatus Terasakiella magnetica]